MQIVLKQIESLGSNTIYFVSDVGRMGLFLLFTIFGLFKRPFRHSALLKEIKLIGAHSFVVIFFTAAFTGMVLGVQGY